MGIRLCICCTREFDRTKRAAFPTLPFCPHCESGRCRKCRGWADSMVPRSGPAICAPTFSTAASDRSVNGSGALVALVRSHFLPQMSSRQTPNRATKTLKRAL